MFRVLKEFFEKTGIGWSWMGKPRRRGNWTRWVREGSAGFWFETCGSLLGTAMCRKSPRLSMGLPNGIFIDLELRCVGAKFHGEF